MANRRHEHHRPKAQFVRGTLLRLGVDRDRGGQFIRTALG